MKNKKVLSKTTLILIGLIVVLAILIVDLVVKHYIVGIDQEAIPGFFKFSYRENTGAAWSILADKTWVLTAISVLAAALLICFAFLSKAKNPLFYISIGLIVGGAFGNMFDRIVFGYVRDFIKILFMSFPVFNIADCALTIGVICLVIYYIIEMVGDIKKSKRKKQD